MVTDMIAPAMATYGIIWLPWLRDSATLHVPSCCQGVIVVNHSCSDGFGRSVAGNNRLKGGSIFHIGSTNGTCYTRGTFNWFQTSESSEGLKNLNHPSTSSTDSSTQFSVMCFAQTEGLTDIVLGS